MKITWREIVVSIIIVALLLWAGLAISKSITENRLEKVDTYTRAIKTSSCDEFAWAIKTEVGDVFAYGTLWTQYPVTLSNTKFARFVDEEYLYTPYMYVYAEWEHYTMHTRTVTETRTRSDGTTYTETHTETYYSWDTVGQDRLDCSSIIFAGVELPCSKIDYHDSHYICSKQLWDDRYTFYGTPLQRNGTIFTSCRDQSIRTCQFHENVGSQEYCDMLIKYVASPVRNVVFWVFWVALMIGAVYGFYYLENDWLE